MANHHSRAWDQGDLTELLSLEDGPQDTFRSTVNDRNVNGRIYAGQLLGQALWAAARTTPQRVPSTLQATFLQAPGPRMRSNTRSRHCRMAGVFPPATSMACRVRRWCSAPM
ncbi:hypothetical protein [Pseudomonas nitroreducens]|uniref:hypothetical protein n=1 Tax=Pseudomonas nitroreducens TaxID=46680 RepID=UPI0004AEE1CA